MRAEHLYSSTQTYLLRYQVINQAFEASLEIDYCWTFTEVHGKDVLHAWSRTDSTSALAHASWTQVDLTGDRS